MARQSYDQLIESITNFVWSNLNKEITGAVLRQYLVNIVHSTAEMRLLDGRSIEKAVSDIETAINELKNNVSSGDGSSVQFSDQFKTVDNVVSLNLKMLTAESDEEPPAPAPATDVIALNTSPVKGFASTDGITAYFNSADDCYVFEFPNGLNIASQWSMLYMFMLNLDSLGYPQLSLEEGDRFYVRAAPVRLNQLFIDSLRGDASIGVKTDPWTGGQWNNRPIDTFVAGEWSVVGPSFICDWYYSLFNYIFVTVNNYYGEEDINLLPGARIEFKNSFNLIRQ